MEASGDVCPRPTISVKANLDFALVNHVVQKEKDIEQASQCMIMCAITNACQLFNYSENDGVCELNTSRKQEHPRDFRARVGHDHFVKGKGLANRNLAEDS